MLCVFLGPKIFAIHFAAINRAEQLHLFPALRAFWFSEKNVLREIRVIGTALMFQLTRNSPTNPYIGQNPRKWKLH